MLRKNIGNYSLKSKLFIYMALTCLTLIIVFGFLVFIMADKMLKENQINDQKMIMESQVRLMTSNVSQATNLVQWINSNQELQTILKRPVESAYEFDRTRQDFNSELDKEISSFSKYISAVFIWGKNGFFVRKGFNAYTISPEEVQASQWFQQSRLSNGEMLWWPVQENYTHIPSVISAADSYHIVKVYKKISCLDTHRPLGEMVILLSPDLFLGEKYEDYSGEEVRFYLVNTSGEVIMDDTLKPVEGEIAAFNQIPGLETVNLKKICKEVTYLTERENLMILYQMSSQANLCLVRVVERSPFWAGNNNLFMSIAVTVAMLIVFSFILSTLLSSNFTRPIERLIEKIQHIACGEFDYQVSGTFHGELKALDDNIQRMEEDIQTFMRENAEKEQEKHNLEMRVLQMQINPHFLYNTLNSIRWMATFQGAKGIESMVTSLGAVLMAACGNGEERISIYEELAVLDHYCQIQKIRYKDKIRVEVVCSEPRLMDCLIPRFTLQPIVENAIFHGIERKSTYGTLRITLESVGDDLKIRVWDDGAGIEPEKLAHILDDANAKEISARGIKGIGLANVHTRLRLAYGEGYGLRVESEKGRYTEITVHIPKEYSQRKDEDHDHTGG